MTSVIAVTGQIIAAKRIGYYDDDIQLGLPFFFVKPPFAGAEDV